MSLADELKRAQARMDSAKKEQKRKPTARKLELAPQQTHGRLRTKL